MPLFHATGHARRSLTRLAGLPRPTDTASASPQPWHLLAEHPHGRPGHPGVQHPLGLAQSLRPPQAGLPQLRHPHRPAAGPPPAQACGDPWPWPSCDSMPHGHLRGPVYSDRIGHQPDQRQAHARYLHFLLPRRARHSPPRVARVPYGSLDGPPNQLAPTGCAAYPHPLRSQLLSGHSAPRVPTGSLGTVAPTRHGPVDQAQASSAHYADRAVHRSAPRPARTLHDAAERDRGTPLVRSHEL